MTAHPATTEHILRDLVFPARYEMLVERLGTQLATVLVSPEQSTHDQFEDAAFGLRARGEGLFLPIHAVSGTGKTTLANNLDTFLPGTFTPTINFEGTVAAESLRIAVSNHLSHFSADEAKIVPINIDHREGNPPSGKELAEIKRFLRMPGTGSRSLIVWPDTSPELSIAMANAYISIAGKTPVSIPLEIVGPPRSTWAEIAKTTLKLSNGLDSLEDLGVDPEDYTASSYRSIGEFLRQISDDFTQLTLKLLRSTRKPLRLAIVFASETSDAGVLTHLTSSNKFGLLDGSALLDASPQSEVGRWWSTRRGLLTQTIMRLDARAFGLPPSASVALIRRHGPEEVADYLKKLGIRNPGDVLVSRNIERSDLGKFLLGLTRATHETKGTPTTTSLAAYQYLASQGFTTGRDKALNRAMAAALAEFCVSKSIQGDVRGEQKLDFCPLIPDNSITGDGSVVCLEYTWRTGSFLTAANRGTVAQYCLSKLRNYSRELGWIAG